MNVAYLRSQRIRMDAQMIREFVGGTCGKKGGRIAGKVVEENEEKQHQVCKGCNSTRIPGNSPLFPLGVSQKFKTRRQKAERNLSRSLRENV